jgi:hypothetical protein
MRYTNSNLTIEPGDHPARCPSLDTLNVVEEGVYDPLSPPEQAGQVEDPDVF